MRYTLTDKKKFEKEMNEAACDISEILTGKHKRKGKKWGRRHLNF